MLKAENDFLKMKLMLENGADFINMDQVDAIPPEIENQFLNYVASFERQLKNPKYITVFEKIQQPDFFRQAAEIPEEEIAEAWRKLNAYLGQFGVNVDVCSPNISCRELYRFTTEELFSEKIDDIDIPGMVTGFIYDEYYPDPVYDNTRMVEDDLLGDIFTKRELFFRIHYAKEGFFFNQQWYEDWNAYAEKIESFKSFFDEIELEDTTVSSCCIKEGECIIKGEYLAAAVQGNSARQFSGSFEIKLVKGYLDYWEFINISIGGFLME